MPHRFLKTLNDEGMLALGCVDPTFDDIDSYLDHMAHVVALNGCIEPEQIFPGNDYHNGRDLYPGLWVRAEEERRPPYRIRKKFRRPEPIPTSKPKPEWQGPTLPHFRIAPGYDPWSVYEVIEHVRQKARESSLDIFNNPPWSLWSCSDCTQRFVLPANAARHTCHVCASSAVKLAAYLA
jgi:hypothetical protein